MLRCRFCTRSAKHILLPVLFLVLVFLLIAIIHLDSITHKDSLNHPYNSFEGKRRAKETMRHYVERTRLCSTSIEQNNTLNLTLQKLCKTISNQTAEYFRLRSEPINKFLYGFKIAEPNICNLGENKELDVLVMVHSHPNNGNQRAAIRESWGTASELNKWPRKNITMSIRVVFVLALLGGHISDSIRSESDSYHDLILGDFEEHYHNMTLKSLLDFKWMLEYCSGAKYLIKSDDDMFINMPYLTEILESTEMTGKIMGPYNDRSTVMRNGKWKLTEKEYPFSYFPPYESGAAYVIESSLISPLYQASSYVPWLFIDDVYITGILGRIVGAKHHLQKGFAYWNTKIPPVCDIINHRVVTVTKQTRIKSRQLWEVIVKGKKCDE